MCKKSANLQKISKATKINKFAKIENHDINANVLENSGNAAKTILLLF